MKSAEKKEELKAQIADLVKRFPAHSLKPTMFAELERLEEKLAELLKKDGEVTKMAHKFNPKMIEKLDNPKRKEILPPEVVIEKSRVHEGMVVVDVGCGIGYFTFPLAKAVGITGKVYGFDISPEMLAEAEKRYVDYSIRENNNVSFSLSGENSFPLEANTVDMIFLANVFHEVNNPGVFLEEVKRVLKETGYLVIVDWKKVETEIGPPVSERLSNEEITDYLQEAGFKQWEFTEIPPAHILVSARIKGN